MALRRTCRSNRTAWQLLLLVIAAVSRPLQADGPTNTGERSERSPFAATGSAEVQRLVEQLGAESYDGREQAAVLLKQIGAEALPFLRRAAEHHDLEVRYRARQLAEEIERAEQERILAEFLSVGEAGLGRLLPGWERFAGIVGQEASARELFVAMYRDEPEIMRLTDRAGFELRAAVEERVLQFRASTRHPRGSRISPATAAVLLFVVLDPNLDVNGAVHETLTAVFGQRQMQDALTESGDSALRRLVSNWIAEADGASAAQRVAVAVQYGFETGVVPSLELLRGPARGGNLQNAIFAVAKLGGPQHLADLAEFLRDDAVLSERENSTAVELQVRVPEVAAQLAQFEGLPLDAAPSAAHDDGRKVVFRSQVGDVALAAMIHLIGQNPYDYGFTELRPHREYLYLQNTAGFDSDDRRGRALRQWILWTKVQRLQSLAIDAIAVAGIGV